MARFFSGICFELKLILILIFSGYYVFAISSDDSSELWLSYDKSPTSARLIAWVGNLTDIIWGAATSDRQFTKYKSQISGKIFLTQGGRYFVEVLHKQSSANDHLLVSWKIPGLKNFSYITSSRISQYIHPHIQHKLDVVQYSQHIPHTPATLKLGIDPKSFQMKHHTATKKFGTMNKMLPTKSVAPAIYPTCSAMHSPSYLVKFNLTRYQGVYLVHETAVYPNDDTDLPHMEQYRPCDEKRDVDSHGQKLPVSWYAVDEEIEPTENDKWGFKTVPEEVNSSVTTDVQFIGRKMLAMSLPVVRSNQKEFPRFKDQTLYRRSQATPRGLAHGKAQKDLAAYGLPGKGKEGNGDNGGVEDKIRIKDKGGVENKGGIGDRGGIGGRHGIEGKGSIAIESRQGILQKHSRKKHRQQGRNLQPDLNLKAGNKPKEQKDNSVASNMSQVETNITPLPVPLTRLPAGFKNTSTGGNQMFETGRSGRYIVSSNRRKKKDFLKDEPKNKVLGHLKDSLSKTAKARDEKERRKSIYLHNSNTQRSAYSSNEQNTTNDNLGNVKSPGKSVYKKIDNKEKQNLHQQVKGDGGNSRRNAKDATGDEGSEKTGGSLNSRDSKDTVRLKRTNGSRKTRHRQQDDSDKPDNEQLNNIVYSQNRRLTGKGGSNTDWTVGVPRIRRLKKSGLWDLVKKYAKEKNLVFTRKTWNYVAWKYLHYHNPRSEKVVEFVYKQNPVKCRIDGNLLLNKDVRTHW